MKAFFISLFIIPIITVAQVAYVPTNAHITNAYCAVIAEYIKEANKNSTVAFDTLFVGKHEEFPDIKLPNTIADKKIVLYTQVKGDKEPYHRSSYKFVNILETKFLKDKVGFMLITFHQDYHPQHNCHIDLKYNEEKKEFELEKKIRYEYLYPNTKK